jgi:hypothetical protein
MDFSWFQDELIPQQQATAKAAVVEARQVAPNDPLTMARIAYWGDRPGGGNTSRASDARRKEQVHIAAQLMVEPCLIVDIHPDPSPEEFQARHDLTICQMQELAVAGYVIPNVYSYLNEGWKEYGPLSHLHPLLKLARINTIWQGEILDLSRAEKDYDAVGKLRSAWRGLSSSTQESVLMAVEKRVGRNPESFFAAYGQRLLYAKELAPKEYFRGVEEKLSGGAIIDAVNELDPVKTIFVSPLTAAFGGRHTLSPEDSEELVAQLGRPVADQQLLDLLERRHTRGLGEALLAMARAGADAVEIEGDLNLERLDNNQFSLLKNSLETEFVRSRRFAELADGLCESTPLPHARAYLDSLCEMEERLRGIEGRGKWFGRLGTVIESATELVEDRTIKYAAYSIGVLLKGAQRASTDTGLHYLPFTKRRRLARRWHEAKKTFPVAKRVG